MKKPYMAPHLKVRKVKFKLICISVGAGDTDSATSSDSEGGTVGVDDPNELFGSSKNTSTFDDSWNESY